MHASALSVLLLQIFLILIVSRIMGALAARIGQPKVVGEMLAGIMLGPSLLGWIAPGAWAFLFPPFSQDLLHALAQIGVIFFLFLIGLELDTRLLRERGQAALVISQLSIIAPFLLGAALTLFLYPRVFNDGPHMSFAIVALFMGAAMSITAFPVLARILTERGLQRTPLGALAITCAAFNDVAAWCMLAFVIALGRAEGLVPGLITVGLSAVYTAIMFFLVRPLLKRLEGLYERRGSSEQAILSLIFLLTLLSAAATDWIGIHALFGAFLLGAIMPKNSRFLGFVTERLEGFTVLFLLPIFFAYAGLKTQIGLLDNATLWGLTGLVVLTACVGKFGGSFIAALASGIHWRESAALGILMNTRGLVELVLLTIGLQLGIITDAVFAMMVIMALATTAMTTPILHWVYPRKLLEAVIARELDATKDFRVMVPISRPESAGGLARVCAALAPAGGSGKVYALGLQQATIHETLGITYPHCDLASGEGLRALLAETSGRGITAEPIAFISRDIASDIARAARAKQADLILMGYHKSFFGEAMFGGVVHRVLTGADTDVAILVDRGLGQKLKVLVPYQGTPHDRLAVSLVRRMASDPDIHVTILHVAPPGQSPDSRAGAPGVRKQSFPDSVEIWVVEDVGPIDAVVQQAGDFDLIVIGLSEEWGIQSHFFGLRAERIAGEWPGSLLFVRKHAPLAGLADDERQYLQNQSSLESQASR